MTKTEQVEIFFGPRSGGEMQKVATLSVEFERLVTKGVWRSRGIEISGVAEEAVWRTLKPLQTLTAGTRSLDGTGECIHRAIYDVLKQGPALNRGNFRFGLRGVTYIVRLSEVILQPAA